MSNQQVLLMNLSLTEILLAITASLWRIMIICKIQSNFFHSKIVSTLGWYFYFVYLFAPFIIMLDKFIGVVYPLKHEKLFPKRRARIVIITTWILGLVLSAPRLLFPSSHKILSFSSLTIQLFVLGFITIAFPIMAFKIRKHKESFSNSHIQSRISTAAGLITISFVLLVILPEIIVSAALLRFSSDLESIAEHTYAIYFITFVNCIVDPILYLYGYPPLRVPIKQKLFKKL